MTRGLASGASCAARGAAVWRRGSFGFVDSVFFLRRHPATRVTGAGSCIPRRSRETSWSCRSRGKVEARTGWSAFSGALVERARTPAMPAKYGLATQPRDSTAAARHAVRWRERPSAACCMACRLWALVRRCRPSYGTDGVCVWLLSVWMSPAVACFPTGGVCRRMSSLASASEAAVSLQGEEDGRPGTVVLSNPADGRAMPLVRGEGNPAACFPRFLTARVGALVFDGRLATH